MTRRRFLTTTAGTGALVVGASALRLPALAGTTTGRRPLPTAGGELGLPGAVHGGELQYFRMSPATIPARIALCEEAAFNLVQTYVPWNVHQWLPGPFDFTGLTHPILPDNHLDEYQEQDPYNEDQTGGLDGRFGLLCNTDLHGFLTMCRDAGLKVVLRPGPFISDEWRNGGLPDWFLDEAPPDMYEYGPAGNPFTATAPFGDYPVANVTGGQTLYYFPQPSYASDHYLAGARGWLTAFGAFVKPWLATNGGPVIAVQVDDESCFFYRFGPFEVDYNPAMLARYRAATGTEPPRTWPLPAAGIPALRPALSWQRFKAGQVATYLGALAADLRAAGVDVPITHEIEQTMVPPTSIADLAQVVLITPETYPGSTGPEVMPTIELTALSVRAAHRNAVPLWATEMDDNVALFNLLIGEGIVGGISFDYTSGVDDSLVSDRGRLGRTLATAGPLLSAATRRADVAVIWDSSLTHLPYGAQRWGFGADVRRIIENDVPALATLLLRSGLSFDLLDVDAAAPPDFLNYPTIFLAAADVLPRSTQDALVAYVRAGGRLVCWPAPPHLDSDLFACSVLRDACYPERTLSFYPEDGQTIEVLGEPVPVWRGVQTYSLSGSSVAIARRAGVPCGYSRPVGKGTAVLLGTWLAADSPAGREGTILEEESLPVPVGGSGPAIALAERLAATHFGPAAAALAAPAAAALIPELLPGGPATSVLVYLYTNERRAGEFICGGVVAYSNGDQTFGLVEVNTTDLELTVSPFPYHPVLPSHVRAVQVLAGVAPHVSVTDLRVQARILDAPVAGGSTVMATNRYPDPVDVVLTTTVAGREVRLPSVGSLTLPAGTGILLPVGYPLGHGVRVVQASVQLSGAAVAAPTATLDVWSPSGGEILVALPGALAGATLDGKAVAASSLPDRVVRVVVPAGDHTLVLRWK